MDLDRGRLARVDRRLLASLNGEETWRMVRLPISDMLWSTWRRYCNAAGLPMGRAVVALIIQELRSLVERSDDAEPPLLAGRATEQVAAREQRLVAQEQHLAAEARRLREWDEQLRSREADLRARERRLDLASRFTRRQPPNGKVGRNEPCPCGSGRKYKYCHGRGSRGGEG